MMEYGNSARGHLIALENNSAMEGYLETMMQGTTLKQKAYATLVSSEMHAETIEQFLSLPWRAVVSSVKVFRRRNENHSEDTRYDGHTLCENRVTTEVRLVYDWYDTRGL